MKNRLLTGLVLAAATLTAGAVKMDQMVIILLPVLSFFVHRLDKESALESL